MTKTKKSKTGIVILCFLLLIAVLIGGIYYSNKKLERESYKREFNAYVDKYSSEYGVDSLLVYAFIFTESGFNPNAISDAGATGLMQIMPDTYEWIKFRMKDKESESYEDMLIPEINIKYGTYLISLLQEEFQTVPETAAAYHAGRTEVNDWLKNSEVSSNGKTLDVIPISQTDYYVEKIVKNYDKYKEFYEDE